MINQNLANSTTVSSQNQNVPTHVNKTRLGSVNKIFHFNNFLSFYENGKGIFISKIFSSNSNNNQNQQPTQKRGGLHRIFSINSSKSNLANNNNSSSIKFPIDDLPSISQTNNDSLKTNNSADNIENILKKYSTKSTTNASQPPEKPVNQAVLIGF